MKITIEGDAKEIAALLMAIAGRQDAERLMDHLTESMDKTIAAASSHILAGQ